MSSKTSSEARPVPPEPLRFGPFTLHPGTGDLLHDGETVALQPQPARVLAELARRPGELVTRRELEELLWDPDTHVDREQGLNFCIRQVRAALGDDGRRPAYVETLPRRGYRFIAPVETAPPPPATRGEGGAGTDRRRELPRAALLLAGVFLVAALVAYAWPGAPPPTEPASRDPAGGGSSGTAGSGLAPAPAPRVLLAVLPLRPIRSQGDPVDFAAGLTEELTTRLGQLRSRRLGVISHTSARRFAGSSRSAREIGAALDADYLLEGSVRRDGDRVRISLRLVRTDHEAQIWNRTYERRLVDVFAVQRQVARDVAAALARELAGPGPAPDPGAATAAPSPETFASYLQGTRLLEAGRLEEALPLLRRAVELEPDFIDGWLALTHLYHQLRPHDRDHVARAEAAARRALELDPDSGTAHFLLGRLLLYYGFRVDEARGHLERAVEINPSDAAALHQLASLHAMQGRHGEAEAELRRAIRLDPLTLAVRSDLGWFALFARDFSGAEEHLGPTLEVAGGGVAYWTGRALLGTYVRGGRWDAAADLAVGWPETAAPRPGVPAPRVAPHPDGPRATVEAFLRHELTILEDLHRKGEFAASNRAVNHALLGEADRALDLLELSAEEGWGWQLLYLRVDPRFDDLRDHPRFQALADRLGLPRPAPPEPPPLVTR